MNPEFDLDERPFVVIWEVTQACDLACVHCRASAQPLRHSGELDHLEAQGLIDQIADLHPPVFVLTGGDPLKRLDIFDLVEYANRRGVRTSLTPSATPLVSRQAIRELKARGLARLAISLDGSTAEIHDAFRGVEGSFQRTLDAVCWAREAGLPVQINTTVARWNLADFDAIAALLNTMEIALWSVFFLVPTGRGRNSGVITADEFEQVFARLYRLSGSAAFDIKTTEAQHYRRYALQQRTAEKRAAGQAESGAQKQPGWAVHTPAAIRDGAGPVPRGINDAKGFVFVSHTGEVYPSGFLPLSGGNIRRRKLAEIYRSSELFVSLRNTDLLKGKCGVCEYREVCGGSRARAFAVSGDPLGEEPNCAYIPPAFQANASKDSRHPSPGEFSSGKPGAAPTDRSQSARA